MLAIRPFDFSDVDYDTLVAIDTIAAPEFPMTVADWQHADQNRNPDDYFRRDLIMLEGQPVAYAECKQFAHYVADRKYFFDVVVLPDYDDPAIYAAYQSHLLAVLADRNPAVLITGTLDDRAVCMAFLASDGFVQVMREQFSELDLTAFDGTSFADIPARIADRGIAIVSLPELQARDPEWKQKLYELDWTLTQDVPASSPPVKPPLEEFERKRLGGPNYAPDCWFVALDGEQLVAQSYVIVNASLPDTLYTGLTGVRREYRRQGIATALKLRVIDYARQAGITTIVTSNEAHNPMLQLNVALGFRPKPAWVTYEKQVASMPQ